MKKLMKFHLIYLNLLIKTMITTKIEKLKQMANFEGDVRDGNIGDFLLVAEVHKPIFKLFTFSVNNNIL